jgi:hypothetical protein
MLVSKIANGKYLSMPSDLDDVEGLQIYIDKHGERVIIGACYVGSARSFGDTVARARDIIQLSAALLSRHIVIPRLGAGQNEPCLLFRRPEAPDSVQKFS